MNLVDKRHAVKCHYGCKIPQYKKKELKKNTIGSLRHRIQEQQSLLTEVRSSMSRLQLISKVAAKKKGCIDFLKRVFNVFTCYAFSPIKKARKGIAHHRNNKIILKANIANILSEAECRQRLEIDGWWNDNLAIIKECFVEKSINRFKTIAFQTLNEQFTIKRAKYAKASVRLLNNLIEIQSNNIKFKLGEVPEDVCFIQALANHEHSIEEISALFSKFKSDKNIFVIVPFHEIKFDIR